MIEEFLTKTVFMGGGGGRRVFGRWGREEGTVWKRCGGGGVSFQ